MPNPISSSSSRNVSWNEDSFDRDDLDVSFATKDSDEFADADELSIVTVATGKSADETASAAPEPTVLRPEPGQLQHLPPHIAKLIQPAFDRLAQSNGGERLDVSTITFVVQDLGGATGHTVRDRIEISPEELKRPLDKQLYVVGHELAHVLQFEVIGPPGADADTRWHMMEERYASEARGPGRGSQYDIPPNLTFTGLDVVDRRYPLEAIAARVGKETGGRLFGP